MNNIFILIHTNDTIKSIDTHWMSVCKLWIITDYQFIVDYYMLYYNWIINYYYLYIFISILFIVKFCEINLQIFHLRKLFANVSSQNVSFAKPFAKSTICETSSQMTLRKMYDLRNLFAKSAICETSSQMTRLIMEY